MQAKFMTVLLGGMLLLAATASAQEGTTAAVSPAVYSYGDFTIYPHVAAGGQWTTEFIVSGNTAQSYQGSNITLFSDGPNMFSVKSPDGQSAVLNFSSLSSNETRIYEITSTDGQLHEGWANFACRAGSCPNVTMIVRNSILSTGYYSEAFEPGMKTIYNVNDALGIKAHTARISYDNRDNFHSSMALTNGDAVVLGGARYPNMPVTVNVYDQAGNQIGSHAFNLTQGQHLAFRLEDAFPETLNTRVP